MTENGDELKQGDTIISNTNVKGENTVTVTGTGITYNNQNNLEYLNRAFYQDDIYSSNTNNLSVDSKKYGKCNKKIWIIIAIISLVVIAAIIVTIVIIKKKRQ